MSPSAVSWQVQELNAGGVTVTQVPPRPLLHTVQATAMLHVYSWQRKGRCLQMAAGVVDSRWLVLMTVHDCSCWCIMTTTQVGLQFIAPERRRETPYQKLCHVCEQHFGEMSKAQRKAWHTT